LLANF